MPDFSLSKAKKEAVFFTCRGHDNGGIFASFPLKNSLISAKKYPMPTTLCCPSIHFIHYCVYNVRFSTANPFQVKKIIAIGCKTKMPVI